MRASLLRAGLAALAVAAATVLTTAGAANAAPSTQANDWFAVSTSKVVLQPQATGGYKGETTLKVTYVGSNQDGVSWPTVSIMPPKGLNFKWLDDDIQACTSWLPSVCSLNGNFKPFETHTIRVGFEGYAAPKDFARIASGGWMSVEAYTGPGGPFSKASFSGILASKTGSVKNPKPYEPSTVADMALTGSDVTLVHNEDGTWTASLDLAASYKNDAINYGGSLYYELPGGADYPNLDPGAMCMGGWCELPVAGYRLNEGSVTTVKFTWSFAADTAPGVYTGFVRVAVNDNSGSEPTDANPADNTVALSVTIP